jgi:hypothetical protein
LGFHWQQQQQQQQHLELSIYGFQDMLVSFCVSLCHSDFLSCYLQLTIKILAKVLSLMLDICYGTLQMFVQHMNIFFKLGLAVLGQHLFYLGQCLCQFSSLLLGDFLCNYSIISCNVGSIIPLMTPVGMEISNYM